ncbi:hypothetical protein [Chitinolyticbacter meiyuanensis]|uniref:hypothetical protein n=1 Tax=Chitinolyticbacter meiyuanensis TaxID=682798 RepID=UPI00165253AF|nr:hypothetical protein [Chitinolyticbacter meiyuanensis]
MATGADGDRSTFSEAKNRLPPRSSAYPNERPEAGSGVQQKARTARAVGRSQRFC